MIADPTDILAWQRLSDNLTTSGRLEQHDPWFLEFAKQPRLLELVGPLVNGAPELVGAETFNKPALVGSAVPPHQDNAYFCQSPADVLTVYDERNAKAAGWAQRFREYEDRDDPNLVLAIGGDGTMLKGGDRLRLTQSAVVLENLISQFLFNKAQEGKDGK